MPQDTDESGFSGTALLATLAWLGIGNMPTDNEEAGFAQEVLPRRAGQVFWATSYTSLAELRSVPLEERRQFQVRFIFETLGLYYYDQNSVATESSPNIIKPTDSTGRWILVFGIGQIGAINIYKQASTPALKEGDIWYDTSNQQWRGCNGTDWDTILG